MATAAVAAAVARARREIQHHFFSHDAVRPDRAVAFEPSKHIEQRQFERMRSRGIIREAKPGLFWPTLSLTTSTCASVTQPFAGSCW